MPIVMIQESLAPTPPRTRNGIRRFGWRAAALELSLLFFTLAVFSWLGVDLAHHSGGVSTIWLTSGILFAIVIRKPRPVWPLYAIVGLTADILADVAIGDPLGVALGVSVSNSIEVFLPAYLLTRRFGNPLLLSRPRPLFGFLGVAVLAAPALTGILSTTWLLLFGPLPWWQTVRVWYLGDVLGMAIVAPLVYALQQPGFFAMFQRRKLAKTLLVLAIPTLAATVDFSQQSEPIALLLFPALVFAVFQLRFPGAAVSIFLIACIAIPLTVLGHGPMTFSVGTSMLHKIAVVQAFLAISLFTAFPVAALLEERGSLESSLQQSEARFRELANTDALTGQANRRAFDERLDIEWRRSTAPLALLSLDVDLFKKYNDIYGHIAGDDCLRRIAAIAADALLDRATARLYRLGGEEFAAILPGASLDEALGFAQRIRSAVFDASIEHTGSPLGRQTVSIGVAAALPGPGRTALSLLALSDQALYNAKRGGRNRCEAAA